MMGATLCRPMGQPKPMLRTQPIVQAPPASSLPIREAGQPSGGLVRIGLTLAGWLIAASPAWLPATASAQDLVGCQLTDGSLQCVPGLTATPQEQIQIMRQEISTDIQLQGAVQQQINGLQSLVLQGQAVEGGLLAASALTQGPGAPPNPTYHWYRLTPGQTRWQLIKGATGPTYALTAADVGQQVLVVAVVQQSDGRVQRMPSAPTNPIQGNSKP